MKLMYNMQLQAFLDICAQIKFPVSLDKTFWGTMVITFLGFLINTVTQTVSIPIEKIEKAKHQLASILSNRKCKVSVKQMEILIGFLNFIGRCIIPGRAFTRRLYAVMANKNLKPHHHIRLTHETILDLCMWEKFINHASIFSRPFLNYTDIVTADTIDFFTDASGKIGFGGICGLVWMHGRWPKCFIDQKPSIEFQELYALLAGILAWLHLFQNKRVIIFCDNQSIVAMVNKTTSSCHRSMVLIRILVLHCLKWNTRVFA